MHSGQNFEIVGRHLAALPIGNELEANLLALMQIAEAGTLYSADVDEGISAAVIRRNETEALLGIEPFYGSRGHGKPFHRHRFSLTREAAGRRIRVFGREDVRPGAIFISTLPSLLAVYRLSKYVLSYVEIQGRFQNYF